MWYGRSSDSVLFGLMMDRRIAADDFRLQCGDVGAIGMMDGSPRCPQRSATIRFC
jgi:hypothetical protein